MVVAYGADSDFDGLDDTVETNTGVYVSSSNTGTNPSASDSDSDGVPDGLEVKEKTSPVDATKFNNFSKNLKIYLNFEQGLANISGHPRSISPIGNPTIASSIDGSGIRFDGIDDAIYFSNDSDLPLYRSNWGNPPSAINQGPLTISLWVKQDAGGNAEQCIIGKRDYTSFNLVTRNGYIAGEARWPGVQPDPVLALDSSQEIRDHWHYITYIWDKPSFKIFVDGILTKEISASNIVELASVSKPWVIGAKSDLQIASVEFFKGTVDNVRVYDRALGANEVFSLYASETFKVSTENALTGGSITGGGNFISGSTQTLIALPSPGYIFDSWTGDASGSANPTTVLIDADKTVGATFVQDTRDPDSDGLSNYQELIVHGSNPDLADTDGDGINDGAEVQQGRSPKVAEPVVSNISAVQRAGTKLVDITYDVTADTPTVKVTLEISSDGGQTFTVPAVTTSGALGSAITTGTGKVITWNAGVDWNGRPSNQLRFKVVADDLRGSIVYIPAGPFTMGRTSGDTDSNAPPVNVIVSQFHMGKNEVTKAEWDEVWTWAIDNGYTDLGAGAGKAYNHPVHSVNWFDIVKWCNARSQREGLTPCYTVSGSVMKIGTTAPSVNWTANGYRLPTEAEWEKAARGGVSGKRFPWGTDTISHSQANYNASTSYSYDASGTVNNYHPTYNDGTTPYTSPVGSFAANGYGLHDTAGNVWEWCWDWYGASTNVNGATDPRGAASGAGRVRRGGGWSNGANYCRAANRFNTPSSTGSSGFGFRVARSSVP